MSLLDRPSSPWWLYLVVLSQLVLPSFRLFQSRSHRARVTLPRTPLSDKWLRELERESAKR